MQNNIKFEFDTIAGNVHDLESALNKIKALIKVKPFIRFELELKDGKIVPVALIVIGKYNLELLGGAEGFRPKNFGHIENIIIETPHEMTGVYELGLNLKVEIINNKNLKKPRIIGFKIKSPLFKDDADILRKLCGFKYVSSNENAIYLNSADIKVDLIRSNGLSSKLNPKITFENDIYQAFPGWHRIGLTCKDLEAATKHLVEAGGKILVSPYKVLPGLNESMIYLPSGLIV